MKYRVDTYIFDQLDLEDELDHLDALGWQIVSVSCMGDMGNTAKKASITYSDKQVSNRLYKWCVVSQKKVKQGWWQRG